MHTSLKQFGRISGILVVAGAFLLLSAPHSVSIADDDIKALERKLELLKKKASRKNEYKQMRDMLGVKLKEVQDQIQMLDEEYKDVSKPAPPAAAKKKAAAGGFSAMINLMKVADISLSLPESNSEQPFRVKKRDGHWGLQHRNNFNEGKIIDEGKNKISLKEFPDGWPINGTWEYSKNGNNCRIDQLKSDVRPGERIMRWKC
jgi:hypothetical protein